MNQPARTAAEILLSTAFTLIILGLLYAPISIGGVPLFSLGVWKLGLLMLLIVMLWKIFPVFFGGERIRVYPSPLPFLFGFWIVVLSDYRERNFAYFAHPFSLWSIGVVALLAAFGFATFKNTKSKNLTLFSTLAVVLLAAVYFKEVSGRLIFSDDHPSFLYRLSLLAEQFPHIPFYNPRWNAGYSAREFFATGSLNVFLILFPFLKLGALNNPVNYSYLIGALPFVIFPASIFLSQKVLRAGVITTSASILLCLAPSLDFFEWFLLYGTIGFICSLILIPLVFTLAYKLLLSDEQLGGKGIALLLLASTFCFFWTLSIAVFVPLGVYALLFSVRSFSKARAKKVLLFVLVFLSLNGVWLSTFVTHSKVAGFVSNTELPGAKKKAKETIAVTLVKGEKKFLELTSKINPILLFLGFAGLFVMKDRRFSKALTLTLLWLFVLSSFGDSFKAQFELRRMSLIAAVLLILPASFCIEYLLTESLLVTASQKLKKGIAISIIAALLIVPINAGAIYANRSDIHFRYASDDVWELSKLLQEINSGGRAFFFGFILHELGASAPGHQDGGHLAPLAIWSQRELFASHFFHARWSSVDPVPPYFLKRGAEGIEEFLDLMNVTEVVAVRKEWIKYCSNNSKYQERGAAGRFHVYSRTAYKPTPLLEGEGEIVESKPGILKIKPHSPKVVLKYRYFPFLKSDTPEVRISGRFLFDELIGAHQMEKFEAIELEISQSFIDSGRVLTLSY